ncbi:hypothetical protein A8924_0716 [Saccharopolyspora erythraea NRRL 2338]|uniref:Uncharacterized protein n=1 Tax=Saccharopolyspora erythraea TaxID=1836 RepID=A0ABN1DF33_SACER|nr:hypothetical protein [Saccharopolyspora erythraea]EQD85418.1 hypothetical protein N599_15025 [Saccharopolyspora erythraea D]PFG93473.1 hypothetical protein A8924_0716 [Saccharopolyspora erythraea NRRL 2338]
MAVRETDLLCHELLLRLAGRLPDRHLWRYRDWLAGGAADVLARMLPGTLVRERIPLGDGDFRLLRDALFPLGADPALVNAILPAKQTRPAHTFVATSHTDDSGDPAILVLGATLRGRQGVREVRSSWRRGDGLPLKRVLLVTASADVVGLTSEIQRILRALGEPEPCVEVLPPDVEPTAYHRAALAESALVCEGADELAGHRG